MKGDFLSLYDKYFDDVYRYIYFKTNNKWDADDIVSDIFKKAFEKFDTVTGSPKAWLFTIARNALTDFYRRKKFIPIDENNETCLQAEDMGSSLEDKDMMNYIKKSLKELPEDELEIIRLRYFSNMKYREISEVIGRNEGFVKTKSNRIIKKLRAVASKYLEGLL